jgi:hypothetical protein
MGRWLAPRRVPIFRGAHAPAWRAQRWRQTLWGSQPPPPGKIKLLLYSSVIDILPLVSRYLYQLMFTPGGTSVCLQRLPQPLVV